MIATTHPAARALLAAILFGASTPLAKPLAGEIGAFVLAGLLYLGCGLGLGAWQLMSRGARSPVTRAGWPWLAAAVACGGIAGPVLLMWGLARTPAASAALLLNLEAAFTAVLAWVVFREHTSLRVASGVVAIVAGGVLLSWQGGGAGLDVGALAVAAACLAWALDNNLTRKVAHADPVRVAAVKGLVAGPVNLGLGVALGQSLPAAGDALAAGLLGLAGYGVSLALYVSALRDLGAARTGAYFATAPFFGVALALALAPSAVTGALFWAAGALMALGVWLHLSERHAHFHRHEPLAHEHPHVHDAHHRHRHDFEWDGREPHSHPHVHEPQTHAHPHHPDLHHRHEH